MICVVAPVTSATVEAALAKLPPTGDRIVFPPGVHQLQRSIILKTYNTTLEGACGPHPYLGNAATTLIFPASTPGIIVQGRGAGQGERCGIRGLFLTATKGSPAAGITVNGTRTAIEDCGIHGFAGDGILIYGGGTPTLPTTGINANLWTVNRSSAWNCGGDGLHIEGNDANGGTATNFSSEGCLGNGVHEEYTLGNTYIGCHTAANKGRAYFTYGGSVFSTFIGCYAEAGQLPSWFAQKSMRIGGDIGAIDSMPLNGMLAGGDISSNGYGVKMPLMEGPLVKGMKPPATGVVGDFVVISTLSSGLVWGWRCVSSIGPTWIQEVH